MATGYLQISALQIQHGRIFFSILVEVLVGIRCIIRETLGIGSSAKGMCVVIPEIRIDGMINISPIGTNRETLESIANGHKNSMTPLSITSTEASFMDGIFNEIGADLTSIVATNDVSIHHAPIIDHSLCFWSQHLQITWCGARGSEISTTTTTRLDGKKTSLGK